MLDQSIDKEFLHYYTLLSEPQKNSLLSLVKSFVSKENRITVEEYNNEIEAAEKRIAEGKYTEHSDLVKEASKW